MVLTRQEKEKLVLDLYNQGKNTREIAEARISFRDIGVIQDKAEEEKQTSTKEHCKDKLLLITTRNIKQIFIYL